MIKVSSMKIRTLCERQGMEPSILARSSGIAEGTVKAILARNLYVFPHTLKGLARALGVKESDLTLTED